MWHEYKLQCKHRIALGRECTAEVLFIPKKPQLVVHTALCAHITTTGCSGV